MFQSFSVIEAVEIIRKLFSLEVFIVFTGGERRKYESYIQFIDD